MRVYGRIDRLSPKLDCDIIRDELPSARIFQERFADLCARINRAEYVAARAMIITRDRAERFALCAFAAPRGAEKDEGTISHHGESPLIPDVATIRKQNVYSARRSRERVDVDPSPTTIEPDSAVEQRENCVIAT